MSGRGVPAALTVVLAVCAAAAVAHGSWRWLAMCSYLAALGALACLPTRSADDGAE